MTEIHFTDINSHVSSCRKSGFAQLYLIYGDAYLRQQAADAIEAGILPDPELRSVYLETVDGKDSGGASEAAERAGTYSFFSGPKVVVFYAGDLAKMESDQAEILKSAIKRGFPKNHHLIIQADNVDKRLGLYRSVKDSGTVVDCSVPSGTRKAEREAQRRILGSLAKQTLEAHGKTLDNEAFSRVYELVGPEPGSFVAALDKLALFAKDRPRITKNDADAVLAQTREDPVYLFTNAVGEKNADLALYYLDSLAAAGFHYAQLLTAMANHIRRLSAVKGFITGSGARLWKPGMPFERFKKQVMPAVAEHDKAVADFAENVRQRLHTSASTEMVLAKNTNNPFPVYQNFIQADNFSQAQLDEAICTLHQADTGLKTTGSSPGYLLESVILKICGKNGSQKP